MFNHDPVSRLLLERELLENILEYTYDAVKISISREFNRQRIRPYIINV